MSEFAKKIINDYYQNNQITFKIKHPEIEKVTPSLSVCRIYFNKSKNIIDFNIRLPLIFNYFEILSEILLVDGEIIGIKEKSFDFEKDFRIKNSLLSEKKYKMGLYFIFKHMEQSDKNIIENILKDYNNKDRLSDSDFKNIDDEIFKCLLLSSNVLNDFIIILENAYKISDELEKTKNKFQIEPNGVINASNFKSVLEEFIDQFLSIRVF